MTDKLIEEMSDETLLDQINAFDPYDVEFARRFRAQKARSLSDAEALKAADELERLLRRYFTETPLGHQPHMIDEDTQKALAAYNAKRGERE